MIFKQYKNTNYWVSTCGSVYNMNRGIMMTNTINNTHKYKIVKITQNGIKKDKLVHRLIAETFIPNPENKPQVNHLDGNKLNNNVLNLEWTTPSENQTHSYKSGLHDVKPKGYEVKLNEASVKEIIYLHKNKQSASSIAKMYNVSRRCIGDVIHGKTWKKLK